MKGQIIQKANFYNLKNAASMNKIIWTTHSLKMDLLN